MRLLTSPGPRGRACPCVRARGGWAGRLGRGPCPGARWIAQRRARHRAPGERKGRGQGPRFPRSHRGSAGMQAGLRASAASGPQPRVQCEAHSHKPSRGAALHSCTLPPTPGTPTPPPHDCEPLNKERGFVSSLTCSHASGRKRHRPVSDEY